MLFLFRSWFFLIFLIPLSLSGSNFQPIQIELSELQKVSLEKPLIDGQVSFLSAVSGVSLFDQQLYIVSDDQNFLFKRNESNLKFQTVIKLLPDAMLMDAQKPDFESLLKIDDLLVAWPSLSSPSRMQASIVLMNEKGGVSNRVLDLTNLSKRLMAEMKNQGKSVNIEGLVVFNDEVLLFQRGSSAKNNNGIFRINKTSFLDSLKSNLWNQAIQFQPAELGFLNGIKLGFSDAVLLSASHLNCHKVLITASAEDSKNADGTGKLKGSSLFIYDGKNLNRIGDFAGRKKIEGISVQSSSENETIVLLVDDSDDEFIPSAIYRSIIDNQKLDSGCHLEI